MRSIHDALRSSRPFLPEPLRTDLAPLFADEERLAVLSSRLLVFSRQGVPDRLPPPTFPAECTPPLVDAFAPFRAALAFWHEHPDDPTVPQRLANAITAAGCAQVLVLLGQRITPGSITDARGLPPPRDRLLASAFRPHSQADPLTVAARALAKHAHRGSFWGECTGSVADKNATAEALVNRLLDEATWWNVFGHFAHGLVYEVRLESGHGARWGRAGEEFIGFLEPFEDTP
jgi:hypothetical protein